MVRRIEQWVHSLPLRLATKFAVAFTVSAILALAFVAVGASHRERSDLERTVSADLLSQGRALGPVIAEVWAREGAERAREVLAVADAADDDVSLALERATGRPDSSAAPAVVDGRAIVVVPVTTPDGAYRLSLARATPALGATLASGLEMVLAAGLAVAALFVGGAYVLSEWLVGAPLRRVVEQARRVGLGDLERRLPVRGSDEIAGLKRELNAMCDALRDAREQASDEQRRRIEVVEHLRHADRLTTVGTLAAGIAHELGTPLNVILLQVRGIERSPGDSRRVEEGIQMIRTHTERMTAIVRQMLDFARRKEPQRAAADLGEIASTAIALVGPVARTRGCKVTLATPAEPVVAPVDTDAVQQVVTNLLVNAFDAMPSGGTVVIDVGEVARRRPMDVEERAWAFISVTDEGTGIDAATRMRAFEPFFTTKDVGKGTGLGLSVALGIVDDHGGFIELRDAPRGGTVFAVHLPAARAVRGSGPRLRCAEQTSSVS
jgi:signal transduction histidine kinase